MTRGARPKKASWPIPEPLAQEAADILAARAAEGRPPAVVWAAAERRWARRGQVPGGWYTSAAPLADTNPPQRPLVLRVVRLPVRSGVPSLR